MLAGIPNQILLFKLSFRVVCKYFVSQAKNPSEDAELLIYGLPHLLHKNSLIVRNNESKLLWAVIKKMNQNGSLIRLMINRFMCVFNKDFCIIFNISCLIVFQVFQVYYLFVDIVLKVLPVEQAVTSS